MNDPAKLIDSIAELAKELLKFFSLPTPKENDSKKPSD